jgi:hypothetical protein
MILLAAALVLAPTQLPDASQTVSKMLAKYHSAKTITGKVTFIQSAASAKVTITSDIVTQKPNLFWVQQTRTPATQGGANSMLAVGDGKRIGYPAPPGAGTFLQHSPERFFENSKEDLDGNFSAFSGMLLDRSLGVALGLYAPSEVYITISRLRDLKLGEVDLGGKMVYRIDCQLVVSNAVAADPLNGITARPEARIPAVLTISKELDLLGIAWSEKVGTKEQAVDVMSEWKVELEVDKPVDATVFKVR